VTIGYHRHYVMILTKSNPSQLTKIYMILFSDWRYIADRDETVRRQILSSHIHFQVLTKLIIPEVYSL
jgi:hypothetical protein